MTMEEILLRYTRGEATLEETNRALKAVGAGLTLDPARNTISDQELAETTAGDIPTQVSGWGLMSHGFSTLEKVRVENGRTLNVDMGGGAGLCVHRRQAVHSGGDQLTEG